MHCINAICSLIQCRPRYSRSIGRCEIRATCNQASLHDWPHVGRQPRRFRAKRLRSQVCRTRPPRLQTMANSMRAAGRFVKSGIVLSPLAAARLSRRSLASTGSADKQGRDIVRSSSPPISNPPQSLKTFRSVFEPLSKEHPAAHLRKKRYRYRWDFHLRNMIYALIPGFVTWALLTTLEYSHEEELRVLTSFIDQAKEREKENTQASESSDSVGAVTENSKETGTGSTLQHQSKFGILSEASDPDTLDAADENSLVKRIEDLERRLEAIKRERRADAIVAKAKRTLRANNVAQGDRDVLPTR